MKRLWFAIVMVCLGCALLCPSVHGQARVARQSPVDLLIKSEVETAVSMLQILFAKTQVGEMTLEQAKKLGADLLRELRFGKDGYFWADTTEGVNVVLYGRKDVEGRNRIEDKDVKGTLYVKAFLEKAKAGGGYVEYLFPKKGETEPLPKRSYVQAFAPFGWVIGTGYYLEGKRGPVKLPQ
jgi:methyl-accepting chemotaxis protein